MAEEFSTLPIPLYLDELTCIRLDKAFFAQFQIRRALTRYGNQQLTFMRQSLAWKTAKQLPTGKDSDGNIINPELHKARNHALGATQKSFGLTESTFISLAMSMRKHSKWMPNLIDSQAAGNVGREVWTTFEGHLFGGKGRPKPVSWYNSPGTLSGNPRDLGRGEATPEEVDKANSKGKKPPQARKPGWQGVHLVGTYQAGPHTNIEPQGPWTNYTGPLTVVVPINSTREAYAIPLYRLWPTTDRSLSHQVSSPLSHQQERYQYYLSDPSLWHQVKLVRRRVKGHWRYECHLLIKGPPYRPADRYKHVDTSSSVGIDVGTSTLAAVAVSDGVKAAILIKPSADEKAKDKKRAKYLRRQQRALERKRRAANPQAYEGRSKKTDPTTGKPMRTPNTSKAYRALRDKMADQARRTTETKQHQANHIAIKLVQDLGANVYTEAVKVKTWQKWWGKSLLHFAPSDMMTRILREARLAGGTADSLPLSLALTASCHCGSKVKKPLSQRLHRCEVCGAGYSSSPVDRDIHSALLAACVVKDNAGQFYLDTDKASKAYQVGQGLLTTVSSVPRDYFLGTSQSGTTTRVGTEGEVVVTISSNPIDIVASDKDSCLGVRAMGRYGLTEVRDFVVPGSG